MNLFRLITGLLLFLLAGIALFEPMRRVQWYIGIVASEYAHYLALVALLVVLLSWRQRWWGRLGAIFASFALAWSLVPIVQSMQIAQALPERLAAAFGADAKPDYQPLGLKSWLPDVSAWAAEPSKPERLVYRKHTQAGDLDLLIYRADIDAAANAAEVNLGSQGAAETTNKAGTKLSPIWVVSIHGGGWRSNDATQMERYDAWLATQGYSVAALNFRQGKAHPFPASLEDIETAIAFLRKQFQVQGFVLLGRSSGGHLAMQHAYRANAADILGVINYYGPTDLPLAWRDSPEVEILDGRKIIQEFLGQAYTEAPALWQEASPINHVSPAAPPTLIIHGTKDALVPINQALIMADRLGEAGVPHLLLELPWAQHAFDFAAGGPSNRLSQYAVLHFLASLSVSANN